MILGAVVPDKSLRAVHQLRDPTPAMPLLALALVIHQLAANIFRLCEVVIADQIGKLC